MKRRKILVNAISPGPIDTPMTSGMAQSVEKGDQLRTILLDIVPMDRIGNADEIARAVAFLASDDSSFITGIELFADGGLAQI